MRIIVTENQYQILSNNKDKSQLIKSNELFFLKYVYKLSKGNYLGINSTAKKLKKLGLNWSDAYKLSVMYTGAYDLSDDNGNFNNVKKFDFHGNLNLRSTPITELPNNLIVRLSLNLNDSLISNIPKNLQIGGDLLLRDTPLSKKYNDGEINHIIRKNGGWVKGNVYL